jgi:SAM-dependent methyltransferase
MTYRGAMPGTSFDRVAAIYDETRGGERRGDHLADDLAPGIVGPSVVELGVGTGVIARGLRRHGVEVVGFDLSEATMRAAVDRIGPNVAIADADLPGLALEHDGFTSWDEFPDAVADHIQGIENRIYSSMFDVDDATWLRSSNPCWSNCEPCPMRASPACAATVIRSSCGRLHQGSDVWCNRCPRPRCGRLDAQA